MWKQKAFLKNPKSVISPCPVPILIPVTFASTELLWLPTRFLPNYNLSTPFKKLIMKYFYHKKNIIKRKSVRSKQLNPSRPGMYTTLPPRWDPMWKLKQASKRIYTCGMDTPQDIKYKQSLIIVLEIVGFFFLILSLVCLVVVHSRASCPKHYAQCL